MKRISLLALSVSSVSALSLVSIKPAAAIGFCPTFGFATSCNVLITVGSSGTTIQTDSALRPYDGSDDSLVGVINNTSSAITSLPLTSGNTYGGIFGFDRDGICEGSYGTCNGTFNVAGTAVNGYGPTGYEGPGISYTVISGTNGSVNFAGGLQPGGQAYFSLEENPTTAGIVAGPPVTQPPTGGTSVPEPSSVLSTLGFGVLGAGYMLKRKLEQNKLA